MRLQTPEKFLIGTLIEILQFNKNFHLDIQSPQFIFCIDRPLQITAAKL